MELLNYLFKPYVNTVEKDYIIALYKGNTGVIHKFFTKENCFKILDNLRSKGILEKGSLTNKTSKLTQLGKEYVEYGDFAFKLKTIKWITPWISVPISIIAIILSLLTYFYK